MFGSATIEVILGMIFIFLLLSILCSTINEWIAGVLKLRGKTLRSGIFQLLRDDSYPENVNWLAEQFYNHPLVRGLGNESSFPSYIPAETFSKVLINLVLRGNSPDGDAALQETKPLRAYYGQIRETIGEAAKKGNRLSKALMTLLDQAGLDESKMAEIQAGWEQVKVLRQRLESAADLKVEEITVLNETIDRLEGRLEAAERQIDVTLQQAYRNVENYFDDMMDRVSGWYKRGVQVRTIGLALIVTVLLNVDSIDLIRDLSNNPALRSAVVAAADSAGADLDNTVAAVTDSQTGNAATIGEAVEAIDALGLSIGWSVQNTPQDFEELFNRVLGWLVTIIAVSLGTPFWFDIFNKLSNLRMAGDKPKSINDSAERIADAITRRLPR